MKRLESGFFTASPVACARDLIGSILVWHGCEGRVVETEAYAAAGDPACHTFFRPGARNFVESHEAGTAYVYLNYGVHWLFNVLVKGPAGAGFVLVRALEPRAGIERMAARRGTPAIHRLCSGPGKLTRALGIDGGVHGTRFLDGRETAILAGRAVLVRAVPRVGISRGREFPWRFLEAGSPYVSKP
jgi:DNA-3-methyladenine glycosylase